MFHNLKADIIYYKTATDFELEFNLCGCCRMRLLSDKTEDKKSFVHSLARAVSRSSVILIAGPLFGEEGTIKTVADAINTTTEPTDNNTYNISSEQEIEIIKDSVPLVTNEGYFGGCIIESGPQTMILLTDNKSVRKTIMQTLIHPYISELYANSDNHTQGIIAPEVSEPEQTEAEEITEEVTEEITTEDIETEEETAQPEAVETQEDTIQNQLELQIDTTPDDETEEVFDDTQETIDLFFEPSESHRHNTELYDDQYVLNYDDEDDSDYKPKKPNKNVLSICILVISIVLLLVLAVLCYSIFFVPAQSGISPVDNLKEIYNIMFS